MPSASACALRTLTGLFLRERARRPATLVVEYALPVGAVLVGCLAAPEPASVTLPILAIGLPTGMLFASAWEFGVLVEGGFWKRACASPAGGPVAFGAVALAALTGWLATACAAWLVLLSGGAAGAAGLPWLLAAVLCVAPAYAAMGLAVFAGLRRSAAAVTAAPFAYGLLVLLTFLPAPLERRAGAVRSEWELLARLSPVDLSLRLWRRACATPPPEAGVLADLCLGLAWAAVGLLAIHLLLRLLRGRET